MSRFLCGVSLSSMMCMLERVGRGLGHVKKRLIKTSKSVLHRRSNPRTVQCTMKLKILGTPVDPILRIAEMNELILAPEDRTAPEMATLEVVGPLSALVATLFTWLKVRYHSARTSRGSELQNKTPNEIATLLEDETEIVLAAKR